MRAALFHFVAREGALLQQLPLPTTTDWIRNVLNILLFYVVLLDFYDIEIR